MNEKDTLFQQKMTRPGDFVFDQNVVRVFPDMINRSVPGYSLIVPLIGLLARRYAQPDSRIYDLGCSLGAASLAMSQAVNADSTCIIAVDNSPEMIARFREQMVMQEDSVPIETRCQDIRETEIRDASVVVLNFTLQFIDPLDRPLLLEKVAQGLRPGGVLLLSEKICFDDPMEQERQTDWHHDFKRAQGYSELEIARKREALENVLQAETLETHFHRLRTAGFEEVYRWFQGFSFVSMIAIRTEGG